MSNIAEPTPRSQKAVLILLVCVLVVSVASLAASAFVFVATLDILDEMDQDRMMTHEYLNEIERNQRATLMEVLRLQADASPRSGEQ
jgi:flagellar basal body-associated protein FliL